MDEAHWDCWYDEGMIFGGTLGIRPVVTSLRQELSELGLPALSPVNVFENVFEDVAASSEILGGDVGMDTVAEGALENSSGTRRKRMLQHSSPGLAKKMVRVSDIHFFVVFFESFHWMKKVFLRSRSRRMTKNKVDAFWELSAL